MIFGGSNRTADLVKHYMFVVAGRALRNTVALPLQRHLATGTVGLNRAGILTRPGNIRSLGYAGKPKHFALTEYKTL